MLSPSPVHPIAHHRMSDVCQMDPDLVCASRFQVERQEGHSGQAPEDMVDGARLPSIPDPDAHPLPVMLSPADGRLDPSFLLPDLPVHQRQVSLLDHARLELPAERLVGHLCLGDHQNARGIAIQAMHDSRTFHAADSRQALTVGQKRVHQGASPSPSPRMDHHSRGLIQDNEVAILAQDVEGNLLWCKLKRRGRRDMELDPFPGTDPVVGFLGPSTHQHVPLVDQALHPGTR